MFTISCWQSDFSKSFMLFYIVKIIITFANSNISFFKSSKVLESSPGHFSSPKDDQLDSISQHCRSIPPPILDSSSTSLFLTTLCYFAENSLKSFIYFRSCLYFFSGTTPTPKSCYFLLSLGTSSKAPSPRSSMNQAYFQRSAPLVSH